MNDHRGTIIAPSNINIQEHEMDTARAIADLGYNVEFAHRNMGKRVTSADVVIHGVLWEMKSPTSGSRKAIERNLRKAGRQSPNVIIDSQRVKGLSDDAVEKAVRASLPHIKSIKRLWYINRKRKIVDIK